MGAVFITAAVLFALVGLRMLWPVLNRLREDLARIHVVLVPGASVVPCLELLESLSLHVDDLVPEGENTHRITIHIPEDMPVQAIAERLKALDEVRDARSRARLTH